jgi:ATP-dependent DNA helicase DinG
VRAADYLIPGAILARAIAGYEHRQAQVAMADAVDETLRTEGVLLVEAGTGTGKTIGYLLPALLHVAETGKRVIVSTGTKALQDQIMESDLPLLLERLRLDVPVACMKGLSNYVCRRRLEELRRSPDAASGRLARELAIVEPWVARTVTGERADLEGLGDDAPVWGQITSSSESRVGARCVHYDECFVTRMRREADDAGLIVVNHHLFFADLAARGAHGGSVLPDYDAVIFDEAHQIEDVVTRFYGVHVSSTRLEVLARDAERAFVAAGTHEETRMSTDAVRTTADAFFAGLPAGAEGTRTSISGDVFAGALADHMYALDSALDAVVALAKRRQTLTSAAGESLGQIARRAEVLRNELAFIAEGGRDGNVTWAETRGRRTALGASPVDVSVLLREELFYRTRAVVLTSATLTTGKGYDYIKSRLGIDFGVREERLPSPFDYEDQSALYLPSHLPDPRDPDYLDQAVHEVRALAEITGGGAFVLCTSFRVMHALAARTEVPFPKLVQGEAPKTTLLERFRALGDAVLFATASFWEGIDVPGPALRLVILDKLPFEVPSDPLVQARTERLRRDGKHPFMDYHVPAAALGLKQGFGRLIRSRRDRGIVAILDSRIVTKSYGRVFLDSLPPATRCRNLDQAEAFWRGTTL